MLIFAVLGSGKSNAERENVRDIFPCAENARRSVFFRAKLINHSATRLAITYARVLLQGTKADPSFVHLRILAISHCDIAVSHLISSSLLPHPVSSHSNSTTWSFLTRGSRLVSSRLLSSFPGARGPRAVLSFREAKTNLPTASSNQSRASLPSRGNRPNQTARLITAGIQPPTTSIACIYRALITTSTRTRFISAISSERERERP